MNRKTAGAAFILGLAIASPLPALAQGGPGVLPPFEIVTILRSTGLTPLGQPLRRGPNYVLRAIDPDGEEVRVVVDARAGEIVSVTSTESAELAPPRRVYRSYEAGPPSVVYVDPEPMPRRMYRSARPDVMYENERPIYPPAPVPERYSSAPRGSAPIGEPRVIPAPGQGDVTGALPPPPDRFERRAPASQQPSTARPAQPQRNVTTARVSGPPPIPRPRPADPVEAAPASGAPASDNAPLPPPVPENRPAVDQVPH